MDPGGLFFDPGRGPAPDMLAAFSAAAASGGGAVSLLRMPSCWLYEGPALVSKGRMLHAALRRTESAASALADAALEADAPAALAAEACGEAGRALVASYPGCTASHADVREWLRAAKRGPCAEAAAAMARLRTDPGSRRPSPAALLAPAAAAAYDASLEALLDILVRPEIATGGEITEQFQTIVGAVGDVFPDGPLHEMIRWMEGLWTRMLPRYGIETEAAGGIGVDLFSVFIDYVQGLREEFATRDFAWRLRLGIECDQLLTANEGILALGKGLCDFVGACRAPDSVGIAGGQAMLGRVLADQPLPPHPSDAAALAADYARELATAYTTMPPLTARMFAGIYGEGRSAPAEIAAMMRTPPETLAQTVMLCKSLSLATRVVRQMLRRTIVQACQRQQLLEAAARPIEDA